MQRKTIRDDFRHILVVCWRNPTWSKRIYFESIVKQSIFGSSVDLIYMLTSEDRCNVAIEIMPCSLPWSGIVTSFTRTTPYYIFLPFVLLLSHYCLLFLRCSNKNYTFSLHEIVLRDNTVVVTLYNIL